MKCSIIISLLSASAAIAGTNNTVQSFFLPETFPNAYVGSVVTADASSTVYAYACTSGLSSYCATGVTVTATEGPSLYQAAIAISTEGVALSGAISCQITGSTVAGCIATVSGSGPGGSVSTILTNTYASSEFAYHPITITAGAEKLSGAITKSPSPPTDSPSTTSSQKPTGNAAAPTGVIGLAAGFIIPGMALVAGAML